MLKQDVFKDHHICTESTKHRFVSSSGFSVIILSLVYATDESEARVVRTMVESEARDVTTCMMLREEDTNRNTQRHGIGVLFILLYLSFSKKIKSGVDKLRVAK